MIELSDILYVFRSGIVLGSVLGFAFWLFSWGCSALLRLIQNII